jgi:hypothetical protein
MQPSGRASSTVGACGEGIEAEIVSVSTSTFVSTLPIAREPRTRAHSHDGRLITSVYTRKRSNFQIGTICTLLDDDNTTTSSNLNKKYRKLVNCSLLTSYIILYYVNIST